MNRRNHKGETIDPETILTILLNAIPKGINYQIIRDYIENLKQILAQKNQRALIYGINKPTLNGLALKYPEQFFAFMNQYYQGVFFHPNEFNQRNSKEMRGSLNEALQRTLTMKNNG